MQSHLYLSVLKPGDWNPIDQAGSRADSFEYVMHGKIYRIDGEEVTGESSASYYLNSNPNLR